jgi:Flp pilus assembly pilin Flp
MVLNSAGQRAGRYPNNPRTKKATAMANKIHHLQKLARDTRGAGFVEYIILVGLIALFCIIGFQTFGDAVKAKVEEQAGTVGTIRGK